MNSQGLEPVHRICIAAKRLEPKEAASLSQQHLYDLCRKNCVATAFDGADFVATLLNDNLNDPMDWEGIDFE